jgi:hypothetical protein
VWRSDQEGRESDVLVQASSRLPGHRCPLSYRAIHSEGEDRSQVRHGSGDRQRTRARSSRVANLGWRSSAACLDDCPIDACFGDPSRVPRPCSCANDGASLGWPTPRRPTTALSEQGRGNAWVADTWAPHQVLT